jgi:hypothetical protein
MNCGSGIASNAKAGEERAELIEFGWLHFSFILFAKVLLAPEDNERKRSTNLDCGGLTPLFNLDCGGSTPLCSAAA